jgi:hypothetical protein
MAAKVLDTAGMKIFGKTSLADFRNGTIANANSTTTKLIIEAVINKPSSTSPRLRWIPVKRKNIPDSTLETANIHSPNPEFLFDPVAWYRLKTPMVLSK